MDEPHRAVREDLPIESLDRQEGHAVGLEEFRGESGQSGCLGHEVPVVLVDQPTGTLRDLRLEDVRGVRRAMRLRPPAGDPVREYLRLEPWQS